MWDEKTGEYRARTQRNRRIFARALLYTLPVVGGNWYATSRSMPDPYCPPMELLAFACLFTLAAVMMTAGSIFDGIIWVAQRAPTPLLRFGLATGLLAVPFFFYPPVALLLPFLLIGVVARAGWREGNADTHVRSDISPVAVAAFRFCAQAALGAVMAVLWGVTREMLRRFVDYDTMGWMLMALAANAWFWLVVLIARTAWRAATEPEEVRAQS